MVTNCNYLHKRDRKKKYTHQLVAYLKAIWVLAHYRSVVHLKAFILNNQDWLLAEIKEQVLDGFPKEERRDLAPLLDIPTHIREQLKSISSSTIERLLKPIKSVLKRKIPVEPHYHKPSGKGVFERCA